MSSTSKKYLLWLHMILATVILLQVVQLQKNNTTITNLQLAVRQLQEENSVASNKPIIQDCPEAKPITTSATTAPVAVTQPETTSRLTQETQTGPSFFELGQKYKTDKTAGQAHWNQNTFKFPGAVNPKCRVWGHYYHTLYEKWLKPWTSKTSEEVQFLEIGFSGGAGFAAFVDYLPTAEHHSIELQCDQFPRRQSAPWYASYEEEGRFHCGDSSHVDFLMETYEKMQSATAGAKPLKIVVEDASHMSHHQVAAIFFWFPRIEPGGIMIIEDIQPNRLSWAFRQEFWPQLLWDLHYCGDPLEAFPADAMCFPTLQPLLHSVHCEMHICVLQRNEVPARKSLSRHESTPPPNALNLQMCIDKKAAATKAPK